MSFKWWPIRRAVQLSVIALIATPLFGLTFFSGNLAAGELFGIRLADPLAFLQATLASHVFVASFLGSAVLITALYLISGGRSFCGWICPVYLLTEIGDRVRRRLGSGARTFALSGIRWSLFATIVLSALTGIPLFEIFSPIGITARAVMFKAWLPLLLLIAILTVEIFISRRIWCRSLCPAGGFYSLLGRFSPIRVSFLPHLCTRCGECRLICPVEEVLAPPLEKNVLQIASGDCTRCGDCIDICPTRALGVDIWYK